MAIVDMPLEELRTYRPDVAQPDDFDEFWARTLEQARADAPAPTLTRWDGPSRELDVFDVRFPGFGGELIAAWLIMPKNLTDTTPCVVEFNGYGGGRGFPTERLGWANAGYVYINMDSRGQGSEWASGGVTPDPHGSGPAAGGVMTRGIESPETYYYRRFFTDVVRCVDFARSLDFVDLDRLCVTGGSQGGAATLAAGALGTGIGAVMADVPFLLHFRRALDITEKNPYHELITYMSVHRDSVERVFETLSYFDGVNFGRRITAPTMLSTGLRDLTCPPSTVFAVANHMPTPPEMVVYPFNQHEGGGHHQWLRQVAWLGERFGTATLGAHE